MTVCALLAELIGKGIILRLSEDRLRILVPREVLTPELRSALVGVKPQLLRLLELTEQYRRLLRQAWAPTADGAEGQRERLRFGDEQARFLDELGPALAAVLADFEAQAWHRRAAASPSCHGCGHCQECAGGEAD